MKHFKRWISFLLALVMTLGCIPAVGVVRAAPAGSQVEDLGDRVTIKAETYTVHVAKDGFRYGFTKPDGTVIAEAHSTSGVCYGPEGGEPLPVETASYVGEETGKFVFDAVNTAGQKAQIKLIPQPTYLQMQIFPEPVAAAKENGRLMQTGSSGQGLLAFGPAFDGGNLEISMKMKLSDLKESSASGLVFGFQDTKHFLHVRLKHGGVMELFQWNGSASKLADVPCTFAAEEWIPVQVTWKDQTLTVTAMGETMTHTFEEKISGQIGMRTYDDTVEFDDITVKGTVNGQETVLSYDFADGKMPAEAKEYAGGWETMADTADGAQTTRFVMDARTAGIDPVYGLGDFGAQANDFHDTGSDGRVRARDTANVLGLTRLTGAVAGSDRDAVANRGSCKRFVSTFALFPSRGMAEVLFEEGAKRVAFTETENLQGVFGEEQVDRLYYFFGDMKQIYADYQKVRNQEGYPDKKPNSRMFELGWEAYGAMGWSPTQAKSQESIQGFLDRGYPVRWAVIGSGFWKGSRGSAEEGNTTSFGLWGDEERGRFPDVADFKQFLQDRNVKLILGLRNTFKAPASEGGHHNETNNGPFMQQAMDQGYLLKKEDGSLLKITSGEFPARPYYLLDSRNPDAVKWYTEQCRLWGVDGFKEDAMHYQDTYDDGMWNVLNESLVDDNNLIIVRNSAYSVPGDLMRINDTYFGNGKDFHHDPDRMPINLLNDAASGACNTYPDIIGGTPTENIKNPEFQKYVVRNAQFAALCPSMSVGRRIWDMENPAYEACVKNAVDWHDTYVPYIYSAAIDSYNTGYPYTMTPLHVAYADDTNTYQMISREKRQYQWLIGESLMAAPLFGNDFASTDARDVYLPQGKWMDYNTGEIFSGPMTLKNRNHPLDEIPVFVGGKGILVGRQEDKRFGEVFPVSDKGTVYQYTGMDGTTVSTITNKAEGLSGALEVWDTTANQKVESTKQANGAVRFPMVDGHNYELRGGQAAEPAVTVKASVTEPVEVGTEVTLNAVVTGIENPTYQWFAGADAEGKDAKAVEGATAAAFTPDTSEVGVTYYGCQAGQLMSKFVKVEVKEVAPQPPDQVQEVKLEENQFSDVTTDLPNINGTTIACEVRPVGGCSGGSALMFQPGQEGNFHVEMKFPTLAAGTYKMFLGSKTYNNRGKYDVSVNGTKIGQIDGFGSGDIKEFEIGTVTFTEDPAESVLRFDSAGKNPQSQGSSYSLIMDYVRFEPAPEEVKLEEHQFQIKDTNLTETNGVSVVCELERPVGGVSGGKAFMFQPNSARKNDTEIWYAELTTDEHILPGKYQLFIGTKTATNRGLYDVKVNGTKVGQIDGYDASSKVLEREIGYLEITPDQKSLVVRFECAGKNPNAQLESHNLIMDYVRLVPTEEIPAAEEIIYADDKGTAYVEKDPAKWQDADKAWGPEGHTGRVSQDSKAETIFSRYEDPKPGNRNYEVWAFHAAENKEGAKARYTIQTGGGMWIFEADQSQGTGWTKLGVVTVVGNTSTEITLSSNGGKTLFAGAVKLIRTNDQADPNATPGGGGSKDPAILVNQSGYDYGASKQATVVNIPGDTPFYLKDSKTKDVLFEGKVQDMSWSGILYDNTNSQGEERSVQGGIIDFTAFNPEKMTEVYVECGSVVSFPFVIAKNWMQRVSLPSATDFMEQTRSDYGTDPGWLQYGWRDSHQFSYELPSLVQQYMSNPSYYNNQPYDIWRAEDCMFPDLREQKEPNIVWLMKFGMERYYDIRFNGDVDPEPEKHDGHGYVNHRPPEIALGYAGGWGNNKPGPVYLHGMIKEQMAYVLYIYPQISQWMSKEEYLKYRDFLINEWAESRCSLSFHTVSGEKHNLFETQTVAGNLKGGFPPAHSVVPNLMMYEVVKRDMEDPELVTDTLKAIDPEKFFDAAYRNCQYVLEHFPMDDPQYSKGQRMNEHIVMENMAYFQEMYPDRAPKMLLPAIEKWADKMIARSANLWGAHMAEAVSAGDNRDYWTGSAYDQQLPSPGFPNNTLNEPGNLSGFQAAALAAARVITDPVKQDKLREIGVWSIDGLFGRNPYGRTCFFSCTRTVQPDGTPDYKDRNTDLIVPGHPQEIEGTDLGWMERDLRMGSGVLAIARGRIDASPKEWAYPYNPDSPGGYKEGWVTYNTAWNSSLAYAAADGIEISAAAEGDHVNVVLHAPNNLDYTKQEFVDIDVTDLTTGEVTTLKLMEDGVDGLTFSGTYQGKGTYENLEFSYGYGNFRRSAAAVLGGDDFVPVTEIQLEKTAMTVSSGDSFTIPVKAVLPENATNKNVTWSSSDPGVVRVLQDGKFLAVKQGSPVTLTASCTGSDATATCTVTVEEAGAQRLEVTAEKESIKVDEPLQLNVVMRMADGTQMAIPQDMVLHYALDDYSKARVSDEGVVTGKRPGAVTVTVTATYKNTTVEGKLTLSVHTDLEEVGRFQFEKKTGSTYAPADNLTTSEGAEGTVKGLNDKNYDALTFKPTKVGQWMQLNDLPLQPGEYIVKLCAKKSPSYGYGPHQISIDGKDVTVFDSGSGDSWYIPYDLGTVTLSGETHTFRMTAVGPDKFNAAVDYVAFYRSHSAEYPDNDLTELVKYIQLAEERLSQLPAGDAGLEAALEAAKKLRDEVDHPDQQAINAGTEALKAELERLDHTDSDLQAVIQEAEKAAADAKAAADQAALEAEAAKNAAEEAAKSEAKDKTAAEAAAKAAEDAAKQAEAAKAAAEAAQKAAEEAAAAQTLTDAEAAKAEAVKEAAKAEAAKKEAEAARKEAEKQLEAQKEQEKHEQENPDNPHIPVIPPIVRPENPEVPEFTDVERDDYFYDAVQWAVAQNITTGTGWNSFSPDAVCTRAQAVTFLWRAAGQPAPKQTVMPFTDVTPDAYYRDAVLWAVENDITAGTSATTFSPDAVCTRGQIVTFQWRAAGRPAAGTANPFTDVAADAFYADAVLWAVEHDITAGTSATTFSPDAVCTRAQIVTFLYRAQFG